LVETAKGSAGLWLLGLPGTSASVVSDIVARNKQAQADVAVIASEGIKEVEKAEEGVPGTIVEGLEIDATDIGQEAIKAKAEGKSVEEFVEGQSIVYHGSPVPLKQFSKKKGGVFFTDEYADATGFAGTPDNVYEGYLSSAETRSASEKKFEKFCEGCDSVQWIYKNGDKGAEYFSVVYMDSFGKQKSFYPDYIISKNGELWIIEPRAALTAQAGVRI